MDNYPEILKKENRSAYFKQMDKNKVNVRLTSEEKSVILNEMAKDGWTNMSSFIRYKLFGWDSDKIIKKTLKNKDVTGIRFILSNKINGLNNMYSFIMKEYENDKESLKLQGIKDEKSWINATNKWISKLTKTNRDTLKLLERINRALENIDSEEE